MAGGPAEIVPEYMQRAWDFATSRSSESSTRIAAARSEATTAPRAINPDVITVPALPAKVALSAMDRATSTELFGAARDDIVGMLTGKFSDFIARYFPEDTYVIEAQNWIKRALTVGGAGINVGVEAAIWERARARTLKDAQRAQDELSVVWAARRFPVPPGAYMNASLQIARGAQDAIAEAARTQAIEAFKMEVDNARLAVDKAIALRTLALTSAGDYIKALSLGPQIASTIASTIIDSQVKFSSVTADYYRAQLSAVEIPVRVATTNAELKSRTTSENLRAEMETLSQRVAAVIAGAQMTGTQAAAALNAIHTQASIAGSSNDSVVTSIEG